MSARVPAKLWRRLWPRRLQSQTICVVVLAFILALGMSIGWQHHRHQQALELFSQRLPLEHLGTVTELLRNTPKQEWRRTLKSWRRPGIKLWISDSSRLRESSSHAEKRLCAELRQVLGESATAKVMLDPPPRRWRREANHHPIHTDNPPRLLAEVQLDDSHWLHMRAWPPKILNPPGYQSVIIMALACGIVLLALLLLLRSITRPLSALSRAANRMGRGSKVSPLTEQGPDDIRDTVRAFNAMNQRVERFVEERTQMLAALSHDLRTPITTMRLRLEMMPESAEQQKLLESLDEMAEMSERTLAFIREGNGNEPLQTVDVSSLMHSLCDDCEDRGAAVSRRIQDGLTSQARPLALKRALANIIDNAIRYGGDAQVLLERSDKALLIVIDDNGPGIPEEELERVFEPFYRLESSRSRSTGGSGLGLSIARQWLRAMGGELELRNRSDQSGKIIGLRASVSLLA